MPKPSSGETQQEFVSRCMGDEAMRSEFPEQEQRAAVCHTQWREHQKAAPVGLLETKALQGEVKLRKDGNAVEGYAALWDVVDLDDDVFVKGAFARAAKELHPKNQIKFRFNHTIPVGVLTHFAEDSKGLEYAAEISDTVFGRDLKTLIKDKAVDQSSPQFRASSVAYDENRLGRRGYPVRKILEAFPTVEISVLDLGAQPDSTASMKALGLHAPVLARLATLYEIGALDLGTPKSALPFRDLPLAERDREWDSKSAEGRVREWAAQQPNPDAALAQAYLVVDVRRAGAADAFTHLIADVVDGELKAVPAGLAEVAARTLDVESQGHVELYYRKMRREFGDDSERAPWEQKVVQIESSVARLTTSLKGLREALAAR